MSCHDRSKDMLDSVSEGYPVEIKKPTSNVMLICLEVKMHGCKFMRIVKRVKC